MSKFLDEIGLAHFWACIKARLPKVARSTDMQEKGDPAMYFVTDDSGTRVSKLRFGGNEYSMQGDKGDKGDKGDTGANGKDGVSITGITQQVSMESGGENTLQISTSDGKVATFKIRNGNASTSGTEIVQTAGTATDKVMSQKSVTDELQNKLDKASIKTVNGQSLLGGGNIQLTGEDMLLEQGAGLLINEAVNSNTS
jgi:hypothetical protein